MDEHLKTGKIGESMAVNWLKHQGFNMVAVNWRYSYYEIDIIATKNEILHFIEVKTRTSTVYGQPEESVSKKKFRFLKNAAVEYMRLNPHWPRVQYDILAITLKKKEPEFYLMQDVYM